MGTLATLLAGKKIPTPEDRYWADVEGNIENVNGVLKITRIGVTYHLKIPPDKAAEAREAMSNLHHTVPRRAERDRLHQARR